MKKILTLLACTFCTFALEANPILLSNGDYRLTDTTTFDDYGTHAAEDLLGYGGSSVSDLEYAGDFVAWQHNYVFDPAAEVLHNGSLKLTFQDDNATLFGFDLGFEDLAPEYAGGFAFEVGSGGFSLGSTEIDTGSYTIDVDVEYLDSGAFGVAIYSQFGDFSIVESELTIDYTGETAPVPEPSTIALFGLGFLGMLYVKRRKQK